MSSKFRDLLFDNIEETVSALGDDVAGLRQQLSEGIESVDDVDVAREHMRRVGNAMKYLDEMFADLDEISRETCRESICKTRPNPSPKLRPNSQSLSFGFGPMLDALRGTSKPEKDEDVKVDGKSESDLNDDCEKRDAKPSDPRKNPLDPVQTSAQTQADRMIEEVSQKAHKQFGIPLELARQDVRRVAKVTGFLDAFAAIEAACK
jgi:hypothetical protein